LVLSTYMWHYARWHANEAELTYPT
jgi:hypothetical protein